VPVPEFGGLEFGAASLIDMSKLHLDWYSWILRDGPKPEFLRKQVAYYVMGAECWRYADSLDEITAKHDTYFLDSVCNANDVFTSGSLGAAPGRGQPDVYVYDPRNTKGPEVAAEAQADGNSLIDQRLMLALRGRQLVYHTAGFENDTELSGFFRLRAWLSIDCPDTDLYASIHEIDLDGRMIRLSTDAVRARYREGPGTSRLIRTVEPLPYDFCHFTFMSRQIKRGHRLRLIISPVGRLIGSTFTQKNYNGGGVVSHESTEHGRAVTVRLFHDDVHPSALRVPLGRPE
jgi:putative CocE/NonD family hydrolase